MKVRPSVVIVENNHILLMRYRYGDWDVFNLPGGNTEENEGLEKTLVREMQEELFLDIEVGPLVCMGEVLLSDTQSTLHCVFEAAIVGGIPRLNPKETSALEIVWKPIAELDSLAMYPNVKEALQDFFITQKGGKYIGKIDQQWY